MASFSNGFGEVLPDRIVFYVRKSLFGGSIREDLPIRHITSVRHETQRHAVAGVLLLLVGLACLGSGSGGAVMIGLVLIAFAVLLLVGTPSVTINTAGGDRRTSLGRPFQATDTQSYAAAVREALFATP